MGHFPFTFSPGSTRSVHLGTYRGAIAAAELFDVMRTRLLNKISDAPLVSSWCTLRIDPTLTTGRGLGPRPVITLN